MNSNPSDFEVSFAVTELQHAMLLESLIAPDEGGYTLQKRFPLDHPIDVVAFERAWQELINRRPALRTKFSIDSGTPTQQILRHVPFVLEKHDWRGLDSAAQGERLRQLLRADRRRPFDFTQGPPMRFVLLRFADARYEFVWTSHHAMMDGRSYLTLMLEAFRLYEAAGSSGQVELDVRRPYSDYVHWLARQDPAEAEEFWRNELRGVQAPTPLILNTDRKLEDGEEALANSTIRVSGEATARMRAFAKRHRVSMGSVVHAVWAILLQRYSGRPEVVFGTTRSCRFSPAGTKDPLGLLLNTLPLRIVVHPTATVADFVSRIANKQRTVRKFEHTPHSFIRRSSEIPPGVPLFESIVVCNDATFLDFLRTEGGPSWANRGCILEEQPHAPLTLTVSRAPQLEVQLGYFRRRFEDVTIDQMLQDFLILFEAVVATPQVPIDALPHFNMRERTSKVQMLNGVGPAIRDGLRLSGTSHERAHTADEHFWLDRLSSAEPLPVPFARRAVGPLSGHYDVRVPAPSELCAEGRCDTRLLAALFAFLARVSGEEDGFDVSIKWNEPHCDHVVFRAPSLAEGSTLSMLEDDTAQRLAEAALHGPCPTAIVERQLPDRAPLLRDGLPIAIEKVDEIGRSITGSPATALLVQIARDGSGYCLWVAEGSHSKADANRLGRLLTTFLCGLSASPDADLCRVPLMTSDERQRVLVEWNSTATPYPKQSGVHDLFVEQARIRPHDPAIVFEGTTWMYADVDRRSSELASRLRARGVRHRVLVGVYLERSADLVVSLLAVMQIGAAYVPLDPIYPQERIAYMVKDAGVALVITQQSLEAHLLPFGVPTLTLDGHHEPAAVEYVDCAAGPEDLAYVIYTSGSTGRPKGVEVRRQGLTNLLSSMVQVSRFGPKDALLAVTTVCFDIAALELFLPLVCGACVEVLPASVCSDGFELRKRIEERCPTMMQATPATWRMLIAVGWKGDPALKILTGGEHLPEDLASALLARAGEVWNVYGPTETTIWSSTCRIRQDEVVTIGRPIANTSFFILDSRRQPVPPGVAGELHIGGDGVAKGYLGRPELTREQFVPNPFAATDGLLYRTGDRVRALPDSRVEYLGRFDNQIKLNGYRIELGEIEHALQRHSAIGEAAVVLREDVPGERRLVGYVVSRASANQPSSSELRHHLLATLPEYMLPTAFVFVNRLPLTPNGKINRKALPPPSAQRSDAGHASRVSVTEEEIAAIWRTVLHVESVGLDDNFFDLGGQSLTLMQVVLELRERFSVTVSPLDMFKHPTVRKMALFVEESNGYVVTRTTALSPERAKKNQHAALSNLRRRRAASRTKGSE